MNRYSRYYLIVQGGEFIGTFVVYEASTQQDVERYRDTIMPYGKVGVHVYAYNDAWYWYPDAMRRYKQAKTEKEKEQAE